ncbi:stationary phase inducible protein CsiE [Salmonella enterica subsp. enterica serovar Anatum str. USDA 100]|nr:stationary phase inducible protein CsiE [Salmonella enterica subsp. enterica serovar Anatum str. USDA 100]
MMPTIAPPSVLSAPQRRCQVLLTLFPAGANFATVWKFLFQRAFLIWRFFDFFVFLIFYFLPVFVGIFIFHFL